MAKPTIGELLAGKGKRQLTMTNATDYNTALAAGEAGIDIISGRGMYDEQQIGLMISRNLGPVAGRPWFMDRAQGGGQILERASHHIDLQQALAGRIAAVQAM